MNIIGSIRIYKEMPPLSDEQIRRLEENKPKSDDEIDLSDIPRLTKEELSKFKPWRLRQKKIAKYCKLNQKTSPTLIEEVFRLIFTS